MKANHFHHGWFQEIYQQSDAEMQAALDAMHESFVLPFNSALTEEEFITPAQEKALWDFIQSARASNKTSPDSQLAFDFYKSLPAVENGRSVDDFEDKAKKVLDNLPPGKAKQSISRLIASALSEPHLQKLVLTALAAMIGIGLNKLLGTNAALGGSVVGALVGLTKAKMQGKNIKDALSDIGIDASLGAAGGMFGQLGDQLVSKLPEQMETHIDATWHGGLSESYMSRMAMIAEASDIYSFAYTALKQGVDPNDIVTAWRETLGMKKGNIEDVIRQAQDAIAKEKSGETGQVPEPDQGRLFSRAEMSQPARKMKPKAVREQPPVKTGNAWVDKVIAQKWRKEGREAALAYADDLKWKYIGKLVSTPTGIRRLVDRLDTVDAQRLLSALQQQGIDEQFSRDTDLVKILALAIKRMHPDYRAPIISDIKLIAGVPPRPEMKTPREVLPFGKNRTKSPAGKSTKDLAKVSTPRRTAPTAAKKPNPSTTTTQ